MPISDMLLACGALLMVPHAQALMKNQVFDEQPSSDLVTIPLSKQYVPFVRNNRTIAYRTAYFGQIYVGFPSPQKFHVLMDTGSAHLVVPSSSCNSSACSMHNTYNRSLSFTAVDLDYNGKKANPRNPKRDEVDIEYGTGKLTGAFSREVVCFADHTGLAPGAALERSSCSKVRVIYANDMSDEPFKYFKFDGILGLGLKALSLHPEFNIVGQMTKQHRRMKPQFGIYFAKEDRHPSEISFGGYNPHRASSAVHWAPVYRPRQGHWQLELHKVMVGGEEVEICKSGGCVAIVDSGTSILGVPRGFHPDANQMLARKVPGDTNQQLDCRNHPGPDITFTFTNVEITLGPESYSRPNALRVINTTSNERQLFCRASLLAVHGEGLSQKTWVLGEPMFRKYYTVFDWVYQQIGFTPSAAPDDAHPSNLTHEIVGPPDETQLVPTDVYET